MLYTIVLGGTLKTMIQLDSSDFTHWADGPNAHHQLPQLLRRLVMATLPMPSLIDIPGGSSVVLSGWDGLLEVEAGNAWAPGGVSAWELSCEKNPQRKATHDYDKRTADPKHVDVSCTSFVFVTPRTWGGKREWAKERKEKGPWADVRVLDADDLLAWLEQSPLVARWFARLIGILPDRDEYLLAVMNRQEVLHLDTRSEIVGEITADFADLKGEFRSLAATVAPDESARPGTYDHPEHRALEAKIDLARDLIDRGRVSSARLALKDLKKEAETTSVELEFRVVTNLGACALAEDNVDDACALLETAHRLQPDNQKGIANAALAAQLSKDHERAVKLANKARELDSCDSQATSVLIGELWGAGDVERLEDLVATEVWITQDKQCSLVLVGIRMQQSRFQEAEALCRALTEADPDDAVARLALSECLLNWVQADRLPADDPNDLVTRIREAEAEATRALELFEPTDLRARCREALLARAVARSLLGLAAEAEDDFDAVLSESPADPDAAFNKGVLLLNERRHVEARPLFESLRGTRRWDDAVLLLSVSSLVSGDPAAAVDLLRGNFEFKSPGWDEIRKAEILSQAEAAVGVEDSVESPLESPLKAALERHPNDPRLLVLAATRCEISGELEDAENWLLQALSHAEEPDRQEVLLRLGSLLRDQGRNSEAADRLSEALGGDTLHAAAIPLLHCLLESNRLGDALAWARKIRSTDRHSPGPVLEIEAHVLMRVGDARAAISIYEELNSRADATLADQLNLALTQFRCGERDAALKTVQMVKSSDHRHDPKSILMLAQLKHMLGASDHLEDAYLARRYGHDDPDVQLGYFRMFVGRDKEWVEPDVVAPGCAVLLKSESAEQWWQILDDGEESRGDQELDRNQDLAKQVMGRRVGDTVVLRQDLEELSYEVVDVQSKFVRAFQETAELFSTRFPENTGLSRIKTGGDDYSKVFLAVDQRDQLFREAEPMYRGRRLPLASFSSLLGRSAIEIWRAISLSGSTPIHFGSGSAEEASEGETLLREADGIVLDLIALLTVHELGLAEYLRSRFSRVAVPQHVIDELRQLACTTQRSGNSSGFLGKGDDGRYALSEVPDTHWVSWQEFLQSVLQLAESFDRIPSYRMLDVGDIEGHIAALTEASVGAVYAGDEHPSAKLLLVSDDLFLSSYARSIEIDAVNTQAVLLDLHRSELIADQAYSVWVEWLASLNYRFVRVRPVDIVRRLEANGFVTTPGTRAMFRTLEGPDCTEDSAVSVGVEVIAALAGRAPPLQLELILPLVLATLQHGRKASPILLKFRDEIASRLNLAPSTRNRILQAVNLYIQISR